MKLSRRQIVALVIGIAAYLAIAFIDSPLHHIPGYGSRPAFAAAAATLMAIWWLTEALPIHITACVPILLYPLTGVFGLAGTLAPYVNGYIFLFMGGMCIGAAMQQWDLHRRIALQIMKWVGTDPRRLLAGSLASTAFISMWISNTATAAMMTPIGIAVIHQLEAKLGKKRLKHYGAAIMLSIAYGSNVGGVGTKIGTAPNTQFAVFMQGLDIEVSFLDYLLVGFPFMLLFLPVVWLFLWREGKNDDLGSSIGADVIREELEKLGPLKRAEVVVLAIFLMTTVLWIFGAPLTDLMQTFSKTIKSAHVEGGVAMFAALLLVLAPVGGGQRALGFSGLRLQPWSSLLLLGGGFAMAEGIQSSGLSIWVSAQLSHLASLPPYYQVLAASLVTVGLSAVASNTATIAVMLNVLRAAVAPAWVPTVLFSSTIASSCDFALPAGTPPNAIVFGSGYLTIPKMAKIGVVLDILAAILAATWCYFIVRYVLG